MTNLEYVDQLKRDKKLLKYAKKRIYFVIRNCWCGDFSGQRVLKVQAIEAEIEWLKAEKKEKGKKV